MFRMYDYVAFKKRMNILVSGANGLVGAALVEYLSRHGHDVTRLVRSGPTAEDTIHWQPDQGRLGTDELEGFHAVVHLAGENIAAGRWSEKQKHRIRTSRVQGTHLLATTLARLKSPPGVFITASASGFYGDRGDEILTEASPGGNGFLAKVCQEWEAATAAAHNAQIRVAHLRFGMILAPKGGALGRMLPLFKMGLGGRLGSGRQWWSWLTLPDACQIITHVIHQSDLSGSINTVTPNPVTNTEFTKTLGHVLHRPTLFPAPAFMLRLALGEMADGLLLASTRLQPAKLMESDYAFNHPELKSALGALLDATP